MSCELTQEQRDAQNKIVEVAWRALKGAGLDPEEWMLMEWRKTGDTWNGDTLFHFKSIDQRLYIYIPSKWASVEPEPIAQMIGDQPEPDLLLAAYQELIRLKENQDGIEEEDLTDIARPDEEVIGMVQEALQRAGRLPS